MPGRHRAPPVGLWGCHLDALNAFLELAGQWRCIGPAGGGMVWVGLDYAAAPAAFALAGITVTPERWRELRVIEAGAIEELNRER